MLKVDIHNEDYKGKQMTSCTVEVDGDLLQVCEDLHRVVGSVYANIKNQTPFLAGAFKSIMQTSMNNPEFWALAESQEKASEGVSISLLKKKK